MTQAAHHKITKLLVANRSEIAIRVFRAATEMGIRTVGIYAHEDRFALHRFKSDESYVIGHGMEPIAAYLSVDEVMRPGIYQPLRQSPRSGFITALRTRTATGPIVAAARSITAEMDVELPVYNVQEMTEQLDQALWTRRATSWLIGAFSTVALLMAVAGLYGVISYNVGQRTQEISIRMAMGAQKQQVLQEVVRQGMSLVIIGVLAGLALSIAGAGLVSGILVGVSAKEPVVYIAVTALLLAVAGLANYVPARRAAALDPMKALRGE